MIKVYFFASLKRVVAAILLLASSLLLIECSPEYPEINHIIHIGQSLAAGEHSLPIVTDSASGFGNLRFKIGTHTWKKDYNSGTPELRDSSLFEFVPLTAVERGHEGETIANGLCDHLQATSPGYFKKDKCFLFSFTGEGGRLIRELDKRHDDAKDPRATDRRSGGSYYKTILDDVKRAKSICDKEKKSYSVFAITWMQGESNNSGFVNRWDKPLTDPDSIKLRYIEDLVNLKNDLQHDIAAVTGQETSIPLFTYQTAGPYIGAAQMKACEQEADMYLVAPTYMMPNAENSRIWGTEEHGAGIHLTADGERWLGEQFAKVIRKVKFEKSDWKPLHPLNAKLTPDKKSILLKLYVPAPPLVIDTLFLPAQGHTFGFQVKDGNTDVFIKKVNLIAPDIIKIDLQNPAEGNGIKVIYGNQSFVSVISKPILNISQKDTLINGVSFFAIRFSRDVKREFEKLAMEGSFYLANNEQGPDLTSVIVRKVITDASGKTVLLAERRDLFKNISFKAGQTCVVSRRYPFGNIRDSDKEKSTFKFKDKSYGKRQGVSYPLQNWLIAFDDLPVISK